MDYVQQKLESMLGSGAVMVFDETTDPILVAWRLAKFFAHESCGKCTPCREGTGWIEKVLYRMSHGLGRPDDLDLLLDVGDNISPASTRRSARPRSARSGRARCRRSSASNKSSATRCSR